MVNKGSSFADFVRLHPHTYAHTQFSTKFYNGNDINVTGTELWLTKTRPTSF